VAKQLSPEGHDNDCVGGMKRNGLGRSGWLSRLPNKQTFFTTGVLYGWFYED
jgi:hypothetical protein